MRERYALIVVTLHYQRGDANREEIIREVGLGKGLHAIELRFDSSHHALTPPVVPGGLRDFGIWPVIAIVEFAQIPVGLSTVSTDRFPNLI